MNDKTDKWFSEQEYLYVPQLDKKINTNGEVKSRKDWIKWCKVIDLHAKAGATYNPKLPKGPNIRSTKGFDKSSEFNFEETCREGIPREERIRDCPRYDMEDLFMFNYDDMLNEKPNKKFNKLKNIIFNHIYSNVVQEKEHTKFQEKYYEMKEDGRLDIVNEIYQKLSTYIKKNHLGSDNKVDGSVMCNIAVIIAEYLNKGIWNTQYDFLNNIEEYNKNEEYRFHLFLLKQCFTFKNIFYKKYINGEYIRNWWAINHIRHRFSDRDMLSKNQCAGFRDINGKPIKDY